MSLEGTAHKGKYGQQKSHTHHKLYCKSSIKPRGGLIYFKPIWVGRGGGWGGNRDGGLIWEGVGLI